MTQEPNKWLGKIVNARFGFGGYDDTMIGFGVVLEGGYGVSDFVGTWATRSDRAQWSFEDQRNHFADAVVRLRDVLTAAKKRDVHELIGVPVEVTCSGGKLESWRVLTEVIP